MTINPCFRLAVAVISALAMGACASSAIKSQSVASLKDGYGGGLRYALPMGRLKVQVIAGYFYYPAVPNKDPKKALPAELELALMAPSIVGVEKGPDPSAQYLLSLSPSAMSDDHFCIGLTETGLLKSVNIVTADRSADIVVKLAETVAVAVGGVPGVDAGLENFDVAGSQRQDGIEVWDKAPFVEVLIDPDNENEIKAAQSVIRNAFRARAESAKRNPSGVLKASDREIDAKAVKFRFASDRFGGDSLISINGGHATTPVAPVGPASGIFYRVPVQRLFTVSPVAGLGGKSQSTLAILPDRSSAASIEVTRGPLIRKGTRLVLTDGMLTLVDINKPSEGLAAASLPLNVAGAIIETPARFFTAIAAATKSETALLNAKAELLQAEAEILKVRQGEDGEVPAGAAFSNSTAIASNPTAPAAFTSGLTCAGS